MFSKNSGYSRQETSFDNFSEAIGMRNGSISVWPGRKEMNLICKSLRNSFTNLLRSNFATATKGGAKKAAANKNAKPEKQKFMKKQKLAASKEMAAAKRSGGNDRSAPFARALFNVENKSADIIENEELLRRQLIAKSWSRWTMLKLHKESEFEAKFVKSRIRAMEELQKISPVLAERAAQISYDAAPITIKPAAEIKPEKLPFE